MQAMIGEIQFKSANENRSFKSLDPGTPGLLVPGTQYCKDSKVMSGRPKKEKEKMLHLFTGKVACTHASLNLTR